MGSPISRREFLLTAFGASAAAAATYHGMHRAPSPRPVPLIGISILPQYRSQVPKSKELLKLLADFTAIIGPIWGVNAEFTYLDHPVQTPGVWNFIFAEDQEACAGALAYHDWDPTKSVNPYAIVEVPESLKAWGEVTTAATHELVEMLVDPGCNYWADPTPLTAEDENSATAMLASKLLAFETADPVENAKFVLNGHKVTDFVYPAYFEPWSDGRVDHLGAISAPHQIALGGYQIVRGSTGVSQVVNIGNGPEELHVIASDDPCGGAAPRKRLCHRARRILRKNRLLVR